MTDRHAADERGQQGEQGVRFRPSATPVAIVGMSVLLPGAADLDTYWRNLLAGTDAITEVPEGRWDADAYYRPGSAGGRAVADQVYCRRGGFVDGLAEVEVTRFGIMPNSVSGTEPDQLIALNVAAAALADASEGAGGGGAGSAGGGRGKERGGLDDWLPDRHRVGVILGRGGYLTPGLVRLDQRVRTAGQLVRTLGELLPDLDSAQLDSIRTAFTDSLGPDSPESAIGLVPNLAASRVANRLDLRGPAYTVDAACASSLVAVDQAVNELASGRCDVMLAGGVHHCHDITLWSVFSQLRALSPSQRIRPFHRGADGILIGEGTGVVVLKRLADAERDGDRVYAVIRGTGVASDGRAAGLVNPDPGGQAHAVRQAWRAAGLDPAQPGSIGLLEAHGTATPAGDNAELATLAEVFGPCDAGTVGGAGTAVIGSVKSMIGHTMPAAGVAGLVKAALAVHHGMLLPTLHCDDPNPALAATRFRPLDRAAPWETTAEQPVRRAAVNAFGFGGINAHVVLEEAPGARTTVTASPASSPGPTASVAEPERVLLLAADTPEALAALLDTDDASVLAAGLDATRPDPRAGRARLGIVDPTAKRLTLARRAVAKGRAWQGRSDVWFRPEPLQADGAGELGSLAFVFPGLEGDFEPRVDDIAAHFGLTDVLPAGARAEVGDVGRHGFGVVGVGLLLDGALRRMGVVPDAVAGHSVGEWTAMVAAGLYDGDEVGVFMATFDPDTVSVPGLAFGALGAPAERVLAALAEEGWADAGIVLSHDNAPGQSMVCGPDTAVEAFVRAMRARGVLSQVLPFQSGFHTPMLAPYLAPIEQAASSFRLRPPTVPVWSGTTAAPFPAGESAVRELFVRHLLEPVRFRQLVEAMYAAGHRTFIQVGTGQLGSLIGDTLSGRDHLVVAANSPHRGGLAQLRRVATALWVSGRATSPALPRTTATATAIAVTADIAGTPATATATATATGDPAPRAAGPSDRSTAPADTPASVRRGRPSTRPPVRLDLGGALVSLDEGTLTRLRAELGSEPVSEPGSRPGQVWNPAPPSVTGVPAAAAPQAAGPSGVVASAAVAAQQAGAAQALGVVRTLGGAALPGAGPASPLDALAARFPAAAELGALLRETADTAAELIGAGRRRPGSAAAYAGGTVQGPGGTVQGSGGSTRDASRRSGGSTGGAVPAGPAGATPATAQPAPLPWRTTVRVSPDTMPYLLDHCFFPQRPGWPDVADRWPVVPATTIVQHMMEAAQRAATQPHPGTRAAPVAPAPVPIAVHGARFDQWLTATPPVDVDVTVTPVPATPTHRAVSFGPRARATVELAAEYPELTTLPTPWATNPATERIPDHTAAQLYAERWMFHGPAFQGVTELTALGEAHVRGVITTPPAPGSLLDNVGQILGYWIMATRTSRTVVFPVGMRTMRFYGPHPEPGTDVDCFVRITSLTDTVLEADVQLTVGGQVWAELSGWQDRRFDNDPQTRPVERFPERNTLSQPRPGGWVLLHERWPDLASRDLIMRNSLGGEERSQYERHAPRGRRQWLLGRIAAKDAVRRWLWEREGEGDVFPAEIRVHNDATGRPYVTGAHGRTLPALDVSLAHRAEAGVAIVRPSRPGSGSGDRPDTGQGPGIDIEEVVEHDASTLATALGPAELALLRARSAGGGESEALWFTRFWAAKEAVAKAEGTGFGGRPRDFVVREATDAGDRLTVSGRLASAYTVHCEQTGNPPGLPDREYVVAWTTGPAEEDAAEQGELER
ncbi:polyketide synthase [Streptomyces sp. WI04-05B]|uniref:polyketide synthase n=2 Tax=Streptomyces TaxID=1883 RepID=UPI0029B651D6|nr:MULTISPECIES: polyketide synthase [unclassified Streptomyces]MDX2547346.1 beta-ketoacyl synthase N-terminal-like domain-containing protein [Streptomyces sp. WI04-05B]MDX2589834.1 beta-ketoacyl synthase N-terminal-like domain-containing protein [Streptomyces sp. WI04-05A]